MVFEEVLKFDDVAVLETLVDDYFRLELFSGLAFSESLLVDDFRCVAPSRFF